MADTIDILTTHNISIQYNLASFLQRMLAFILDAVIMIVIMVIFSLFFSWSGTIYLLILILFSSLYHLAFEVFNKGQSPGKHMLKIRVVNFKGAQPDSESLFIRWVFRNLDVTFSLGILSFVFINSSRYRQRLGGVLSKTLVVQLISEDLVSLDSIISLGDDTREIVYPQIKQFEDKDMLLVKQAINRYRKNPNDANEEVIDEIFNKVVERLDLDTRNITKNKSKFLETILVEYILVTR